MRRTLFATALLTASFTLLVPGSAAAQSGRKVRLSSKQRREAKRLFDQGMLAYRRGDYEAAILRWQESYDISGHPLTFEAIANAYEKLDNYEAALEYLRKWREKAPRREHEVLDARIKNYERQLDKQKQAEKAAAAERQRIEEEARRRAEQERQAASGPAPMAIAGWALVSTGAAAVITGVVLDGVAAGQRPDADEACRQSEGLLLCSEDERSAITNSNTLAIAGDALWIGGAALTVGGAALLIVSMLSDDEPEAKPGSDEATKPSAVWLPQLGPTGAGASLRVTF